MYKKKYQNKSVLLFFYIDEIGKHNTHTKYLLNIHMKKKIQGQILNNLRQFICFRIVRMFKKYLRDAKETHRFEKISKYSEVLVDQF